MKRRVGYRGTSWDVEDPQTQDWPFWDRWEAGDFEPDTVEIIDRLVTPGSTFVDVGAWDGPFSLWAARVATSVIAVEPDPVALERLRYNSSANYSSITVVGAALNDYSGTCFIQAPEDVGWGVCTTHLSESGIETPCLTMLDLFRQYEITNASLVKMDVEGAERVVLPHAAPFLASIGVPLLVSMHGHKGIDLSWFDDFGDWSFINDSVNDSWKSVLALP